MWKRMAAGAALAALSTTARAQPAPVGGVLQLSPPKPLLLSAPRHTTAEIARRADGGFVAAWYRDEGSEFDVLARVFDAAGAPLGATIDVAQVVAGKQLGSTVAVDDDGNFVVAWTDEDRGIYARRFDSAGAALGDEFHVNPEAAGEALFEDPSVAMAPDGRFVIAWSRNTNDVYARLYDATGAPVGEVLPVSVPGVAQGLPQAAMHDDGSFVVAFSDHEDSQDIFVRGFDASGAERFAKTKVNADLDGDIDFGNPNYFPALAMQADGAFQVAWLRARTGSGNDAYVRRFTSTGVAREDQILVNTAATSPFDLGFGTDALGATTVVWTESESEVLHARSFDRFARPDGDPYVITSTQGKGLTPRSVAFDANGEFVVAWYGDDADDLHAILAQFFEAPYEGPPPEDPAPAGDPGGGGDAELGKTSAGGALSLGLLLVLGAAAFRRSRR